MPVFACLFPVKELHTHSFFNTSKGKHSLYLADFSFRLLLFSPFLCDPRKGTHTLTPEQAWRSSDHTQSSTRISLRLFSPAFPLSYPLFYEVSLSLSFHLLHISFYLYFQISPALSPSKPRQSKGCVTVLHVSISTREMCFAHLFV